MDNNNTLVHASCYFQDDPKKWATELASVGKTEGYDYIQPTVAMLEECHPENEEVMGLVTMLRQPEWQWRTCENDDKIRFFGIPDEDGTLIARGYYVQGKFETGAVNVLHEFGDTADNVVSTSVVEDPRDEYEARALKIKVWKRRNKYFLVMTGRVVDLVLYGFPGDEIKETGGRGYFGRFPAFAVLEGPFDKKGVQAAKASL